MCFVEALAETSICLNAQAGHGRKRNILDLTKYVDSRVCIKFQGGREGEQLRCLFVQWTCFCVRLVAL